MGTIENTVDNKNNNTIENNKNKIRRKGFSEISNTNIFSSLAGSIPFADLNQSPRNMYQCQMAKQSMGINTDLFRNDKYFSMSYLQKPLVKTKIHDLYSFDDYPIGINSIVAVISYTGYDMEDAMIINKSAVERGMFDGFVYRTITVECKSILKIPNIGDTLNYNDLFYSIVDDSGILNVKYKSYEKG